MTELLDKIDADLARLSPASADTSRGYSLGHTDTVTNAQLAILRDMATALRAMEKRTRT